MAYIRQDYYKGIYGEISEQDFSRLSWDACLLLDGYTTGVDGVKKLKLFFPTDEDDAEAVKRCACKLVNLMLQIEAVEKSAAMAHSYESTEQGMHGKIVSSVSAGNESITYSTKTGTETVIEKAAASATGKANLFHDTIRKYLSGVKDSNGVNLLFMGVYPRV